MSLETLLNGVRLLTLAEVANFLRVSVKTVRRLIDEGKLRSIKVRGARRIWLRDFKAYLEFVNSSGGHHV